jgi:hypothetical protein
VGSKRRERDAAVGVKPIERLDQTQRSNLVEIVTIIRTAIAASEVAREREKMHHERITIARMRSR